MEKTLQIRLEEQRNRIYKAIMELEAPEPMTWNHKLLFEQARIVFAKEVTDAANANV
jgi:hypothetical protein